MITITGKVLNIIEKSPYTNKKGEIIEQVDVDLKDDAERYFNTVSCTPDQVKALEVGDEVTIEVRQFVGASKSGKPFLSNKFVKVYTDEE